MRFYYMVAGLLNPLVLGWLRLKTRLSPKERVRIVVLNHEGEVLLVRPVIGNRKWELPGGMPRRGESYEAAATRELLEETGVTIKKDSLKLTVEYIRPYPMYVYEAQAGRAEIIKNPLEIRQAQWFSAADIPRDTVVYVRHLLKGKGGVV